MMADQSMGGYELTLLRRAQNVVELLVSDFTFELAVLGVGIGLLILLRIRRAIGKRRKVRNFNLSLLLSHYTYQARVVNVGHGTLASGATYDIIATNGASLLYLVQLPFNSNARITAIPKAEGVPQLNPCNITSAMQPVLLEGDFSNHFSVYAPRDQAVHARYVLDPKAMSYMMEFSGTHSWELMNDELFVVASSAGKRVFSLQEIDQFIAEITPRVSEKVTFKKNRAKVKYGSLRFMKAACPMCKTKLETSESWFSCPNNHGYLLTGKALAMLRSGEIVAPANREKIAPESRAMRGALKCPICRHVMKEVNFTQRDIVVDSCVNCHFRWLDAGEQVRLHNTTISLDV